jgi:2,3-bisphosphoglycerate-independent phosphoglycerate mutase
MKKVIIILDGLADKLNEKTSLDLAKKANLDFLVKKGKAGLMYPIKGIAPESGASQFVILGNKLRKFPGRGPIEALGAGYKIKEEEVALRVNFAKIKGKKILDIREKIPNKKTIKKINEIDKDFKLIPTIGYRAVLIVKNISKDISNTHPGYVRYKNFSKAVSSKMIKGCARNKKMNNFIQKVEKLLKNKTILIRGAGNKLPKVKKLKNWCLIADMPVEIGLARLLGMKVLKRKKVIKQIVKCKKNIYFQIKGPDHYGHIGNKKGKIKAIEKVDKMLKPLTKLKNTVICITADHATPPSLKRHSKDPVPVLIYGKGADKVSKFTEKACKKGSLRHFQGKDLMKKL